MDLTRLTVSALAERLRKNECTQKDALDALSKGIRERDTDKRSIRAYVHRRDGKFSVRSGTARIALVPPWDEDVPRRGDLAPFPGAQLQITIPEKVGTAA